MTESRKGELYILVEGILWAFFPIVTTLSYASVSGLASLAWSTLISMFFFAAIVTYRKRWHEMWNAQLWKYVSGLVFFIGILFYVFYFLGLESTTPGNAAIIELFEVFTSFLFFHFFRGEAMSKEYQLGAALMLVGAIIVLGKNFSEINRGDLLILLATVCAPAGNFFQQKARNIASAEMVLLLRTVCATPFLFFLAYAFHASASAAQIKEVIVFLLLNGILFLGLSKILWVEAIHRISVTKAIALNVIRPFLTLVFAWIVLAQAPSAAQFLSLVPFLFGVLLLTDQIRFKSK